MISVWHVVSVSRAGLAVIAVAAGSLAIVMEGNGAVEVVGCVAVGGVSTLVAMAWCRDETDLDRRQVSALSGVVLAVADVVGGSRRASGETMADVDADRPAALLAARFDRFDCCDGGRGLGSRDFGGNPKKLRDLSLALRNLSLTLSLGDIVQNFEELRTRRSRGLLQ